MVEPKSRTSPAPKRKQAKPPSPGRPAFQLGCAYLQITAMPRALDFYQRALGLPLVCRYGDDWAEVDAGTMRIGLHPAWGPGEIGKSGGATLAFYVPDLDALIQRLRAHGMKPSPPRATERGRMLAFEDSEGNALHASEFDPRWVKDAKYPLPAFAKRRAKRA